MDFRSQLLTVAEAYCRATGRSLARVATLAHNQGAFFSKLQAGGGCTIATYEKVMSWFSDRWPDGVTWPETIARPERRPVANRPSQHSAA